MNLRSAAAGRESAGRSLRSAGGTPPPVAAVRRRARWLRPTVLPDWRRVPRAVAAQDPPRGPRRRPWRYSPPAVPRAPACPAPSAPPSASRVPPAAPRFRRSAMPAGSSSQVPFEGEQAISQPPGIHLVGAGLHPLANLIHPGPVHVRQIRQAGFDLLEIGRGVGEAHLAGGWNSLSAARASSPLVARSVAGRLRGNGWTLCPRPSRHSP